MPTPYLGEIRMVGLNFAPQGWAFCDGQRLPISQYSALFSLIGTTYGGDGITNFALPNMQSRIPRHPSDHVGGPGQMGGQETVSLTINQLPAHNHALHASAETGPFPGPSGNLLAEPNAGALYDANISTQTQAELASGSIANAGGSGAHNNRQPYLAVVFIIALQGTFPPRI